MRKINIIILFSFLFVVGCSSIHKEDNQSEMTFKYPSQCYNEAAQQFDRWDKVNGKVSPGLQSRRQQEKALFLSQCNEGD